MKHWQILSIGILIGITLSGLALLIFRLPDQNSFSYFSPTVSGSFSQDCNDLSVQGKIDINSATASELDTLPGIGSEKAKSIIEFREINGQFESINDLLYVPGIGQSLLDQIKDKIFIR